MARALRRAIRLSVGPNGRFSVLDETKHSAADEEALTLVRAIVPEIEAYYADNGSYAGMTLARLKNTYDRSLAVSKYRLGRVSASTYCVQATTSGRTWRKNDPAASIGPGTCP